MSGSVPGEWKGRAAGGAGATREGAISRRREARGALLQRRASSSSPEVVRRIRLRKVNSAITEATTITTTGKLTGLSRDKPTTT